MTFNGSRSLIYAYNYDFGPTLDALYTIDPVTGATALVNPIDPGNVFAGPPAELFWAELCCPVEAVDTVDTTVADTDTVVDDTLPADDTGIAPCDPEFGWSCATTDARSALWALGLGIAVAGRRRRG